jgi:competence protein ComEC
MAVSASILGRRGQYYLLIPLAVTWGYASLAGFSPSVTRAAIMFSVGLLARAAGRQNASLPGIGFAAAVMVAISPEILRTLSFQLSFAAISGISILTPRLVAAADRLMPQLRLNDREGNRFAAAIVGSFAVSIAATLATWPLVAMNFGGAPVWGGLATIVLLPAVPLLIVLSGLAAVTAGMSSGIAEVIGWPAWLLSEYIVGVAGLFRDIPPGVIDTEGWGVETAVISYGLIYIAFNWSKIRKSGSGSVDRLRKVTAQPFTDRTFASRGVPTWSIFVVGSLAAVAWAGVFTSTGNHDLEVTFFETDRGDMILIRTPNGNSALIDGGRNPFGAVRNLDAALPFWDRSLDLLLVTHPDADHIGGLQAVIERYDVATIAETPTQHGSTVYAAWRRAVDEGPGSLALDAGVIFALDDDVALEVLSAGRPFPDATINDASVVTMLRYGDVSMLLTGDITSVIEHRLVASGDDIRATVLKIPHHGSDTSSTEQFLQAVDPEVAVVQVGSDNRFGHPTPDVMSRVRSIVPDENLFVTAASGDINIRTDGERPWVTTER